MLLAILNSSNNLVKYVAIKNRSPNYLDHGTTLIVLPPDIYVFQILKYNSSPIIKHYEAIHHLVTLRIGDAITGAPDYSSFLITI